MRCETCSLGTPRLEATSAGEYPSEIGRAMVRNVSLPLGDKFVQTTWSAEIVLEGEDDCSLVVAQVSETLPVPVDNREAESSVEEGTEASLARCLVPGINLRASSQALAMRKASASSLSCSSREAPHLRKRVSKTRPQRASTSSTS